MRTAFNTLVCLLYETNLLISYKAKVTVFPEIHTKHINTMWVNVKWSRYKPGVAQMVGRGIALLFHDRGTRRVWVVSSTPQPHFNPGKDPVPILQEAGCPPGPVWTGGKSRPHRDSIPAHQARSRLLYRLSYRAHKRNVSTLWKIWMFNLVVSKVTLGFKRLISWLHTYLMTKSFNWHWLVENTLL